MKRTSRTRFAKTLSVVVAVAASETAALAVDGVKLLGKRPSYPIVISQPGSYQLRTNITLPTAATMIFITAADVTLDLNGFSIIGPSTCNPTTHVCTASDSVEGGVVADAPGVVVRNGVVRGMAGNGITLHQGGRVERVRVSDNAGDGVVIGGESTAQAERVEAYNNGGDGINVSVGLVTNCIANSNGDNGIYAGGGVVTQSIARGNQQHGIYFLDGNGIANENFALNNGAGGIRANGVAFANVAVENAGMGVRNDSGVSLANVAMGNEAEGVGVDQGVVVANYAAGNIEFGIYAESAGTAFNVAQGNGGTGQILSGGELGGNLCDGGLVCPAP